MTKAPERQSAEVEPSADGLPEGWASAPLAEIVSKLVDGSHNPPPKQTTGRPMLSARNIGDAGFLFDEGYRLISPKAFLAEHSRTNVAPRDVLLTIVGSIGRSLVVPEGTDAFALQRSVAVIRPVLVDPNYAAYYFRSPVAQSFFEEKGSGTAQRGVYLRTLAGMPLPLAPQAEQKRIVAKIEELLAQVNASREHLAKVPKILKAFRQSVLAAACSGRLTEDWRETHGSAQSAGELLITLSANRREFLRQNSATRYKPPIKPDLSDIGDVPDSWAVASMDALTCLVTSGSRGWAKYYSESGPIFIRAENINSDSLSLNEVAHVALPKDVEGCRTRVQFGDLLITITGANVTKSALVNIHLDDAYVNQHVALVRPVEREIGEFLYLWTVSPSHGRKKLVIDAYGAGKPGLNLTNIREMPVALPPLDEQHEIVRRVEALFQLADKIETRVAAATNRANKLTQSILAKAFRGELVPTEAELARRENRPYEPAEALLARIRQTRQQNPERK